MGYRLSRITTRTGDGGTTGLATGDRVPKSSQRIVAMGAVDEANSWIGVVLAFGPHDGVAAHLSQAQHDLFEVGAELSLPGLPPRISDAQVAQLEAAVASMNAELEPLREFILPGGCQAASFCHVARTVCRRAESAVVALQLAEPAPQSQLVPYLNRLSDLLFVAARVLNKASGTAEAQWSNPKRP